MTEFGQRPYVSDLTYFEQMRNPTFHGVSSRMKMPESELAKPYMNDGTYSEMEHWMPQIPGWPSFPITGSQPDGPWLNPLPTPWNITCYAWTDDCYNDGETTTITVHTAYPVINVHIPSGGVSAYSFVGPDQLTLTVAADYTSHIYVIFALRVPPNKLGLPEGVTCETTCVVYPCGGECDCTDFAWGSSFNATVARSASKSIAVLDPGGNCGPFSWGVTGTGFTLDNPTTAGLSNTLNADATACGVATVTVTGCDSTVVTAYVRCSEGSVWTSSDPSKDWTSDDQPTVDGTCNSASGLWCGQPSIGAASYMCADYFGFYRYRCYGKNGSTAGYCGGAFGAQHCSEVDCDGFLPNVLSGASCPSQVCYDIGGSDPAFFEVYPVYTKCYYQTYGCAP